MARKLDLKNYTFGMPDQKGVIQLTTYNFQKTIEDMLPHHSLGLNGPGLLKAMDVVKKVEGAKGEVILTEDDYQLIVETCKRFRGFQKYDEQFLRRVYNCPTVPDEGKIIKFSDNGKKGKK